MILDGQAEKRAAGEPGGASGPPTCVRVGVERGQSEGLGAASSMGMITSRLLKYRYAADRLSMIASFLTPFLLFPCTKVVSILCVYI